MWNIIAIWLPLKWLLYIFCTCNYGISQLRTLTFSEQREFCRVVDRNVGRRLYCCIRNLISTTMLYVRDRRHMINCGQYNIVHIGNPCLRFDSNCSATVILKAIVCTGKNVNLMLFSFFFSCLFTSSLLNSIFS